MSHKKDARYRVNTSKRFYTFEPRYEKTFLFAAVSVLSLMFDYCLLQCYFFQLLPLYFGILYLDGHFM